jgi:MFS family permease
MSTSLPARNDVPQMVEHDLTPKERRRALLSSFLGSTVEYYDFLLYLSAAALVFPQVFFAGVDPALGTTLSFVILLAGYIARPIGGLAFGHFGDKFGRKNILFITLMVMGVVSVAIGLLPTSAQIGVAAPIILTVLRVLQGLAVGGEWAGATLMAAETATERNRGAASALAVAGGPTGAVLSTLILAVFSSLPDEQFLSWGWRVPFLLSAALVIIGLYLRLRVTESPEFEAARERGDVHTGVPLARLFTKYPKDTILGTLAPAGPLFMQAILASFLVTYVVNQGFMERQTALFLVTIANFLHIFTIPLVASISDRLGRRPVMLAGAVICIVGVWPMFAMIDSGNAVLIALAFILGNPIMQASMYGPIGAFLAEKFAPEDRYTGVSFTFQMGSVIGAGTAPLMAGLMLGLDNGWGLTNVALWFVFLILVSALCVFLSKETRPRSARR